MIIKPGERVFICVEPANSGGAGWKNVWGSIGIDNYGKTPPPIRIMIKRSGGDPNTNWYPPPGTEADHGGDAIVHPASGRSFGWGFGPGDEGVSIWHQGRPESSPGANDGDEPITFLRELAPR